MPDISSDVRLILASTSPFRRSLLAKLRLPFEIAAPDIDETAQPDEAAEALVMRLAAAKAGAMATEFPESLIIGSDQVACIDHQVLGKPGDRARAIEQLKSASGKTVEFLTGLSLLNSSAGTQQTTCERFKVHFRDLGDAQIARYVDVEQPFNCAGSFKSEGFGITLFERLEGDDPNTLIGLPLIRLVAMLATEGINLP